MVIGSETTVIQDMTRDASFADIAHEVKGIELGRFDSFATRLALAVLRRRAYPQDQFTSIVAGSAFRNCSIQTGGIGMEVRLRK